jgi:hypothetical protein
MSFQSVWGFDPDEAIRAQELSRSKPNVDGFAYDCVAQLPPNVPFDVDAQICELRRLFELDQSHSRVSGTQIRGVIDECDAHN